MLFVEFPQVQYIDFSEIVVEAIIIVISVHLTYQPFFGQSRYEFEGVTRCYALVSGPRRNVPYR